MRELTPHQCRSLPALQPSLNDPPGPPAPTHGHLRPAATNSQHKSSPKQMKKIGWKQNPTRPLNQHPPPRNSYTNHCPLLGNWLNHANYTAKHIHVEKWKHIRSGVQVL